jgi:dihydrofolate reductase
VIGGYAIHGHAIVSADDRIADRDGVTPASLRNDKDWERFQASLDRAAVTVLGRLGHEANPNVRGRNRMVISTSAKGVERRADAFWWNPAEASLGEALAVAAPAGGIVAVPGGRRVFDLFLAVGFDEFHLSTATKVTIPDGIPIFTEILAGRTTAEILAAHGLLSGPVEMLDPVASVLFTRWRPPRA